MIAGNLLHDISLVTSKNCSAKSIFGNTFIKSFISTLQLQFSVIGKNFSTISSRFSKGLKGWESLVKTANRISARFVGITEGGINRDTFMKVSDALAKSASDVALLSNGSLVIFEAIFNGDDDMKTLQGGFEALVNHVGGVMKKTSQVLPKVRGRDL